MSVRSSLQMYRYIIFEGRRRTTYEDVLLYFGAVTFLFFIISGRGNLPNRSMDQRDILHNVRAWSVLYNADQFWGIQHRHGIKGPKMCPTFT